MTLLSIEFGQTLFQIRKGSLCVESYASATLSYTQPTIPSNHLAEDLKGEFLSQDHWIPRNVHLEITFEISFALGLHLSLSRRNILSRCIQSSIVCAELWEQLDLRPLRHLDSANYDDGRCVYRFCLLLSDTGNVPNDDGQRSVCKGWHLSNLRPPSALSSWQLKSVAVKMDFGITGQADTTVHTNHNITEGLADYVSIVRLTDAALRSLLCRNPVRMFGVKMLTSRQTQTLAMVIPSIFIPKYTNLLAVRACLIEPIVKLLLAYKEQKTRAARGRDECREDNTYDVVVEERERDRDGFELDLWITMANTFKHEESTRRLKPLKTISKNVTGFVEHNLHDVFQDYEQQTPVSETISTRDQREIRNCALQDGLERPFTDDLHMEDLEENLILTSSCSPEDPLDLFQNLLSPEMILDSICRINEARKIDLEDEMLGDAQKLSGIHSDPNFHNLTGTQYTTSETDRISDEDIMELDLAFWTREDFRETRETELGERLRATMHNSCDKDDSVLDYDGAWPTPERIHINELGKEGGTKLSSEGTIDRWDVEVEQDSMLWLDMLV